MARWSKKWARLPFLTALLLAVAGGGATAQELARQCHATDYWQCGSSDPADTNAGMIATTDVTANTIAPTHTQGNLPAAQ